MYKSLLHNNLSYLLSKYDKFMYLKLYINNTSNELYNKYIDLVENHNNKILNSNYIDTGFDIYTPNNFICKKKRLTKIDFNISCYSQIYTDNNKIYNTGFYIIPKSNILKTPLRLENNINIINSEYRENLIGMFYTVNKNFYNINQYDKLVQISSPGLLPIYVEIVKN